MLANHNLTFCASQTKMSIFHSSRQVLAKYLHTKVQFHRAVNQKLAEQTTANAFVSTATFQENLNSRKAQANRSVLVQVQSASSHVELYNYCSSIGNVQNMLHYSVGVEPMHFIIVEFSSIDDVQSAFAASSYLEDAHAVPVQSQFLWFRAATRGSKKFKAASNKLAVEHGCRVMKDADIQELLRNANSISEQIQSLHDVTKLNDVGTRLRFLVAKQIEMALTGMFPAAVALPFGSSVNGYGKMGCDLDLVLKLNNKLPSSTPDKRLVYHSKATMGSERSTSQRHMEAIGDILQLFLPGCAQVRRILQARVPIIKYYQQLTDIECDLSMSNVSGVHMSDFLHVMGSIDDRVRPLVFTVRKWAAETGLTNSSPGRWISNFSLTLMVLAFLQSKECCILPSMNQLIKLARREDQITTDDGLNCTFLRDHNVFLNGRTTLAANADSLETLLRKFFEHYSAYDFQHKAVSLNEGMPIAKPDHSALYIVNPLERGLNVSKNVSVDELEKFKAEMRNAVWMLEEDDAVGQCWGLLQLFSAKKKKLIDNDNVKAPKMIDVSSLFSEEYKSDDVKTQVISIKKETKQQIKNLSQHFDVNSTQNSNR